MKHGVVAPALLALASVALAAVAACSSKAPAPAAPQCDPAKCDPGNDCIDDGSGSGPSCHQVCTSQSCPFGWYCNDGQPQSWCVQSSTMLTQQAGQWGTPCLPTDGETGNKACDSGDAFACFAVSPTDASAFCTVFGCAQDSDCPGGWWCATVDKQPNAKTANRSFGQTRTACLPRRYCAPCQLDHDCAPAADGTPQHCVQDSQGNGFCSTECASSGNCTLDAKCAGRSCKVCLPSAGAACKGDDDCPVTAAGGVQHCSSGTCTPECASDTDCDPAQMQTCKAPSTCVPRAGVCKGDGTFCSPCRSDGDCTNGYCLDSALATGFLAGNASTERFCSQKATATCATNRPPAGTCPAYTGKPNWKGIDCSTASDNFSPADQCYGYVSIGTGSSSPGDVPGCWTQNR